MISKDSKLLPRISVVTPSFNQAQYLEATMLSVLAQAYANLEYIVIDGGSNDGSRSIIERYADRLYYWCSEKDRGQYDAINKGFSKSTGEIMAWLNSDDIYLPATFQIVSEIFTQYPQIDWVTTGYPLLLNSKGVAVSCMAMRGFSAKSFFKGECLAGTPWFSTGFIQQESTFWRRSLWEKAGARVDDSLIFAGDFDLWARFFASATLYSVCTPLACFRVHTAQKTHHMDRYLLEATSILKRHNGIIHSAYSTLFNRYLLKYIPIRIKKAIGLAKNIQIIEYNFNLNSWDTVCTDL